MDLKARDKFEVFLDFIGVFMIRTISKTMAKNLLMSYVIKNSKSVCALRTRVRIPPSPPCNDIRSSSERVIYLRYDIALRAMIYACGV